MQPVFVLMILEMLCVNLYVGHICHERKASPVIVVPVMAAFTLLLLGLSALTISTLPGYGEGSFVIFGFLYVIPLALLYRCGIKLTVSVMCLSWSYTMLLFLFAQYLGQLFPEPAQQPAMLLIQTAAYAAQLRLRADDRLDADQVPVRQLGYPDKARPVLVCAREKRNKTGEVVDAQPPKGPRPRLANSLDVSQFRSELWHYVNLA